MRDNWKAARVGVMVLLGIAASVFVYRYVDERATGEQGYSVYALFSDAQGLIPKSRVVVAGISVGYIEEIQLQGAKARVDIHINDSIILHEDAAVAMRSVSILGESILVIRPGTAELAVLGEGDQISTVSEATTTDEILSNVNDIAINVKAVTKQLARSFGTDEAGERLEGALRDVSEALETVNRVLLDNEPVIGRTLQNVESATAEAGPRLVRILDNVEAATLDVRELVRDNRDDLDGALTQADETVAAINRSAHELEQVLQDVGEVTDRTARGEGTVGRLTSDDVLIDEVEGAAEGINNLVGGLARLRTVVELRSEYNFLANTFKTYLGIRLQPAEDR
ncbi:MAG: MlaD family protein, partial [Myxococcota bacterium]